MIFSDEFLENLDLEGFELLEKDLVETLEKVRDMKQNMEAYFELVQEEKRELEIDL